MYCILVVCVCVCACLYNTHYKAREKGIAYKMYMCIFMCVNVNGMYMQCMREYMCMCKLVNDCVHLQILMCARTCANVCVFIHQ